MTNLLFLCARNRLRSPTAERVFANRPGVETASAGLAPLPPFRHPPASRAFAAQTGGPSGAEGDLSTLEV